MILGMHKAPGNRLLLTVVDSKLIGKRFNDGNLQLDLTSSFFNGEEKTEEEISKACAKAFSIYFVGEESVKLGMKLKLIDEDNIKRVRNIPHCQLMRI